MNVPAHQLNEPVLALTTTASVVANDDAFAGARDGYLIVGGVGWRALPTLSPGNDRQAEAQEPHPTEASNQTVPVQPRPVVPNSIAGSPSAIMAGPQSAALEVRQQWEGTVEEVSDNEIVARLRDLTSEANPDERAVFSKDEIPDADQALVSPGAVFYWSIGYERTVFGQKSAKSYIRFRRLPAWTKSEVAAVRREADEMARALGLDR